VIKVYAIMTEKKTKSKQIYIVLYVARESEEKSDA